MLDIISLADMEDIALVIFCLAAVYFALKTFIDRGKRTTNSVKNKVKKKDHYDK